MVKLPSILSSWLGGPGQPSTPRTVNAGVGASIRSMLSPRDDAAGSRVQTLPSLQALPEPIEPLCEADIEATMQKLSSEARPWIKGEFTSVKRLQEAVRNHGYVEQMIETATGKNVAVKCMPTKWIRTSPEEFLSKYPKATERPWWDAGFVRTLNDSDCPFVCKLVGIFHGEEFSYVVTSLATGGDLFSWCDISIAPGIAREKLMKPIVGQFLEGFRWLHNLGISHRDISLENLLLTEDNSAPGLKRVKIIDFGMADMKRLFSNEVRGKQSYQAPEMHEPAKVCDSFLSDAFAVGVVIYCMSVQDYPWISTVKNQCRLFEFIRLSGLTAFARKRNVRKGSGTVLEAWSPALHEVIDSLLEFDPHKRACLGESCFAAAEQKSVWDMAWVKSIPRSISLSKSKRPAK